MTQEDKEFLMKDVSCRLPYGLKVQCTYYEDNEDKIGMTTDFVLTEIDIRNKSNLYWIGGEQLQEKGINGGVRSFASSSDDDDEIIKPYLFPLSSMTEEQKKELKKIACPDGTGYFDCLSFRCPVSHFGEHISFGFMSQVLDWLNANHFDYRGLIPRGLAIDCTGLNVYGKDPE